MKNKKRFAEIIATLGTVFGKEIDKPLVRIYWDTLSAHTDEQIEAACKASLKRCRYFPKPVEIQELIPAAGTSQFEAWGDVMTHLEKGTKPADPNVNEAVRRIGGWDFLSGQNYQELQHQSRRFMEHFSDIKERGPLQIEAGAGTDDRVKRLAEKISE